MLRSLHTLCLQTRKDVDSPFHKPEEPNKPARRSESPGLTPPSPTYNEWPEEEQLGRRNATLDAFLY